jgi:hypothetical protein
VSDPSEVWGLSEAQRLELALALLARKERAADGAAALRGAYPAAPESMVATAAHHVYLEGAPAVVAFLADAELAIRNPGHQLDYGVTWQVLYHLYNWLQFWALLPDANDAMLSLLDDIEYTAEHDDHEALLKTVAELRDVLGGSQPTPEVG